MTDTSLGDGGVGECLDPLDRATQHDTLQAIVMIEVDVQGRDIEVVMCVMALGQAAGELALVMVEDVGQVGQAVATRLLCQSLLVDPLPYQVPDRLGPVPVPVIGEVFLEIGYQIIVQRDGHSLHGVAPVAGSMRIAGRPRALRCFARRT
jgi:hypothetical protein